MQLVLVNALWKSLEKDFAPAENKQIKEQDRSELDSPLPSATHPAGRIFGCNKARS